MTGIQPSIPSVILPQPFTGWTMSDARLLLNAIKEDRLGTNGYQANRAYVELMDHWQAGGQWMGPQGTEAQRGSVLDAVERQFTPSDVIGEVLDNHANALLEHQPVLAWVPQDGVTESDQLTQQADDLAEQFRAWWTKRDFWKLMRIFVKRSRWASWATLRAWVPPSELAPADSPEGQLADDPDTAPEREPTFMFPTGLSLVDALDKVHITAPEPDQAVVYQDPETRDRVGIFSYLFAGADFCELCWADEQGIVHIVTMGEEGITATTREDTIDLGGWLPLVQMDGDLLITEPVRRQQARLNFVESMMVRNAETAGFPERYITNAEPQGIWLTTPPADGPAVKTVTDTDGTTWFLHPTELTLGASITTQLVGITDAVLDPSKPPTRATPSVIFKEPTPATSLVELATHCRRAILVSCKQSHVELDDQSNPSGVSRAQAKATFLSDCNNSRVALESALNQLCAVVLGYAAQMSPEADQLRKLLRPQCTVRVSAGPLSGEETRELNQRTQIGTVSLETALAMSGIDDPATELERIRSQPESRLVWAEKMGAALAALVAAGLTIETAAKLAGVSDEDLKIIQADQAQVPVTEGPTLGPDGQPLPAKGPPPIGPGNDPLGKAIDTRLIGQAIRISSRQ